MRQVVVSKVKRKVQLNASTITTRERSNMLDFDSSPVFEFRVVSGAAGKSMFVTNSTIILLNVLGRIGHRCRFEVLAR